MDDKDILLWIIENLEDDSLVKLFNQSRHHSQELFYHPDTMAKLDRLAAKISRELKTRGWAQEWMNPNSD